MACQAQCQSSYRGSNASPAVGDDPVLFKDAEGDKPFSQIGWIQEGTCIGIDQISVVIIEAAGNMPSLELFDAILYAIGNPRDRDQKSRGIEYLCVLVLEVFFKSCRFDKGV